MNNKPIFSRIFKSSEEVISMFLGLVIVVAVIGLIYNYFQKRRGSVDLPGLTVQKNVDIDNKLNNDSIESKDGLKIYTVKKGDNLWRISETVYGSGYNWVDISKANKLSKPGSLAVGQKLVLPEVEKKLVAVVTKSQGEQKIEAGSKYKVVKNDSLWKISVRTYGDGYKWVSIWQANKSKIFYPDKLEIGMILEIPVTK